MSNIMRFSARRVGQVVPVVQRRGFAASSWRSSGKEDSLHEEAGKRNDTIDNKKAEGLSKKEWQAELASNSESIVKAERGEVKDTAEHIKELQKEATDIMNKTKR